LTTPTGPVDLAGLSGLLARRQFNVSKPHVVFFTLGATEAHGPHLPIVTDTVIGAHLSRLAGQRLEEETGARTFLTPVFTTTAATCASSLAGTVSIPAEVEREALKASLSAWLKSGAERVCLVNLHFDPDHMGAINEALEALSSQQDRLLFPDFTRREHAQRIGGEFATGDCHGGEFETSLMLAAAPEAVATVYQKLPEKKVGLVKAIREGKRSFPEIGMRDGYCGWPAKASPQEGERLYEVLTQIVVEACRAKWGL
jgi:creatinine amidohydrolase